MKNGKRRVKTRCDVCMKVFSYLPRTDGKPQRTICYKHRPRHVYVPLRPGKVIIPDELLRTATAEDTAVEEVQHEQA